MTTTISCRVYRENGKIIGPNIASSQFISNWCEFVDRINQLVAQNPAGSVFKTLAFIEEKSLLPKLADSDYEEMEKSFLMACLHCSAKFWHTFQLEDVIQIPVLLYSLVTDSRAHLYPNFNKICDESLCNDIMIHALKIFVNTYSKMRNSNIEVVASYSYSVPKKIEFPISEFVDCCVFVVTVFKNDLDFVKSTLEHAIRILDELHNSVGYDLRWFYYSSLVKCYEMLLEMVGPIVQESQKTAWEVKIKNLQNLELKSSK